VVIAITLLTTGRLRAQTSRWTEEKAKSWYEQQSWLVGSNYIPTDAINELEMWQAQSFNATQIDKELGWAESLGMSTMRVFLTSSHSLYCLIPAGTRSQNSESSIRPSWGS
jgi:hypothetical protein